MKHTHAHIYIKTYIYLFTQKSMNFQSYLWFIVETGSKTMSRGISDRTGFIELHNVLKHAELAVCRWRHRLKKKGE